MPPKKDRSGRRRVVLAVLVLGLIAVGGTVWWSRRLPETSPREFVVRTYPAPPHYEGDPVSDTTRLLGALNRCLARMDLLKLLDREVEKEMVRAGSRQVAVYRETFRLPSRFSAGDLAARLSDAAVEAGAQPLRFEQSSDPLRREVLYSCSFGFSSEWTPVKIVWVATSRPRVCLIIDDAGYRAGAVLEELYALKAPLTLAVIPGLEFSKEIAKTAPFRGVEIICHLPMEGSEPVRPGDYPFYLERGLSPGKTERLLRKAVMGVPVCRGLNNHMGSVATRDPDLMLQVASVLKSLGMFFVDSKTAPDSMAARAAASVHMPYAERDIFLDNESDPAYIRGQFRRLLKRAEKKGTAVGIGHLHGTTLKALASVIPDAKERGYVFVYASEVVK